MKKILQLFLLLTIIFCQTTYTQQRLEVEGKINLHHDNENDAALNGDIRWNANANNGDGDFEGYVNGQWCSLTTKFIIDCEGVISINGLKFQAEILQAPAGSYDAECNCDDGIDDDGDGDIDCEDSDCGQEECCNIECDCFDGIDNDGDGDVDCSDIDCGQNPCCSLECDCTDGIDNDGDGLTDCNDCDCASEGVCHAVKECDCFDSIDNDGDGNIDGADTDCQEICDDGIDNNGDGLVDCNDIFWCDNHPCCNTPFTECDCTDGIDNDGDGNADCDDFDCCIVTNNQCPNCN